MSTAAKKASLLKRIAVPVLKLGLAAGLIYWLVSTGKITMGPFWGLWEVPWLIPFIFAVALVLIIINNYRWLLLLQGQQIHCTVSQAMRLTFIGMFFNLAMPGSVGGDVIKAYYITQDQAGAKLRAATSVLVDRVVGLYAMGLIAFVAILFNWQRIMESARLRGLAYFIFLVVGGFTAFFLLGFSRRIRGHWLTNKALQKIPGGVLIGRIYDALHAFRHGKKQFVWGIILSILGQSQMIFALYVIANVLHFPNADWKSFSFVLPIGFMATAIPISPSGVGVGQAVFLTLFTWYNGVENTMGPTLITINQVVLGLYGLVGAVFYFMRKGSVRSQAMTVS